MQHQLLTNKTQTAHAQYQRKIVHCTVNDLNERSAVGDLMLTTVDGNGKGDGMEWPYQLTLSVVNQTWKITMISYCISDGCLDVTQSVIP